MLGIDVSEWQGNIDWGQVRAAGVDFAIIRASYGLPSPQGHTDRTFARNWQAAHDAGIRRGAYTWFRASQGPRIQADALADAMGALDATDLSPWCDFETCDGVANNVALGRLAAFLDELEQRTGRTPTIYTGPAFWRSVGGIVSAFARYPLAVAHYGVASPDIPAPWTSYAYWQYTSSGHVPGIPGPVDFDRASLTYLAVDPATLPQEHQHMQLNAPIVAGCSTPSGGGYWEVAADGGIFAFGDAAPFPNNDLPSKRLNAPITGCSSTPSGKGVFLYAADGGVYTFGDAVFAGSVPGM